MPLTQRLFKDASRATTISWGGGEDGAQRIGPGSFPAISGFLPQSGPNHPIFRAVCPPPGGGVGAR